MRYAPARIAACAVLATACATGAPSLPYCDESATLPPLASAECRAEPGVETLAGELSRALDDETSPLLIRVEFDAQSEIQSICAERRVPPGSWHDRAEAGERLPAIASLTSAPACLAGSRLEFNEVGAGRAEVDELIRQCEEEGQRRFDVDRIAGAPSPPAALSAARRIARSCLEYHQIQRDETWIFHRMTRTPSVFVRTEGASSRDRAIVACAEDRGPASPPSFEARQGVSTRRPELVECMRAHGWELRF